MSAKLVFKAFFCGIDILCKFFWLEFVYSRFGDGEKCKKYYFCWEKNTFSKIYRYVLGTFLGDAISLKVLF